MEENKRRQINKGRNGEVASLEEFFKEKMEYGGGNEDAFTRVCRDGRNKPRSLRRFMWRRWMLREENGRLEENKMKD